MKIGLSLCGGGSKGSYELGVWDALKELKINFDIITGSSIGALNGVMMAQDGYDNCAKLWSSVKLSHIMENGFDIDEIDLEKILAASDKLMLKQYIKSSKKNIEPFKLLLKESLDFEKIRNSKKTLGVVVSTFPFLKKEEVVLNNLSNEDMYNYLLASATFFPFFPICKINSKQYVDGGFTDNLPIDFAFKLGATKVIAVDLNNKITHKRYINNPYVDYIYPKWDLGSFLYFNTDVLNRNRLLGYYDTMKYYNFFNGFKYTFVIDELYDKQSHELTLEILNDVIFLRNNNLKTFYKKRDYKDVISFLNKDIIGKIKNHHYFIKCVEELGYIYNLDPSILYTTTDFINEFLLKIKSIENNKVSEEFKLIKTVGKQREYINKCDKINFINFLYYNEFNFDFKILLLQTNIEYYLIFVLFNTLKNNKK